MEGDSTVTVSGWVRSTSVCKGGGFQGQQGRCPTCIRAVQGSEQTRLKLYLSKFSLMPSKLWPNCCRGLSEIKES